MQSGLCSQWQLIRLRGTIPGPSWLTLPGAAPAPPGCSWHMFDAVIVVVSLTLELSLKGVAQEVASLLIFFRCAARPWPLPQPCRPHPPPTRHPMP